MVCFEAAFEDNIGHIVCFAEDRGDMVCYADDKGDIVAYFGEGTPDINGMVSYFERLVCDISVSMVLSTVFVFYLFLIAPISGVFVIQEY